MSRYTDVLAALEGAPKRWLVTGAAGFIGSALVETLLRHGQSVVGVDNFATGHRENLDDVRSVVGEEPSRRFEFVEGDICDLDTCHRISQRIDYVLHQAALGSVPRSLSDPLSSHRANVDGFLNVLMAARDAGVKRVVYASSSSVYGDDPTLPKTESRIGRQLSPYAVTKRVDELYAAVVQDCYGLEIIGLRYFNVFGRRQDPQGAYAAVIPRWLMSLLGDRTCVVFGDGSNSRDFCYIDNTVQANILAAVADSDSTNAVYNVGCDDNTNLLELHQILREQAGRHHAPAATAEATLDDPRAGDVLHSQADISEIRAKLGYEPTHRIRQGMTETVDWFVKNRRRFE